jgi:hypothetical protein
MAEELAPALVATLRHAPMAMRMLVALCGEDPDKWRQAAETTQVAFQARQEFLNAITKGLCREFLLGLNREVA